MPLISFIIPFFRVEKGLLVECIQSIIRTTTADEREIIIVDDGNEIPASEILSRFANQIKIIRQENLGLSEARNTGNRHATGEYIQYIDADDCLTHQYEYCIRILKAKKPDILFFRSSRNKANVFRRIKEYGNGALYMLHNNLRSSVCMFVFKRENLKELRFTPDRVHEDEEFTPRLLLNCKKTIDCPFCAYEYRVRSGSITNHVSPEYKRKRLDNVADIILFLRSINTKDSTARRAMERRVSQLTMDYIYRSFQLTRNWSELRQRCNGLHKQGLLPLPLRPYSWKYLMFALISRLL